MNAKIRPGSIILILMLTGLLLSACAIAKDISQLHELIISFEDPKMTAEDLAFYLVTHNYNAKPMEGYVELQTNGMAYKLIPNGDKPGLCDISPID
ncbi:MAG: hypothetical protein JW999_05140 [Methanotrichaceae archaeon]|nr:hypothetical protein [Methanotrichaceae archaeon]